MNIATRGALVAVLLAAGCTGGSVDPVPTGSSPQPTESEPQALPEVFRPFGDARPAPATHLDLYAGAAFDLPARWVSLNDGHAYHFGPNEEALWVFNYLQRSWGKPRMFTITMSSRQDVSARALARRAYRDLRDDKPRTRSQLLVAGRRAERIRGTFACVPCLDDIVFIPWDHGTTLEVHLRSYRGEDTASRVAVFEEIVASLRAVPRDPYADRVRAYLRAIVAGEGAERYLSDEALTVALQRGLYESRNCGRVTEDLVRIHVVVDDPELGVLYVVSAGDRDVLQMDPAARSDPDALPIVGSIVEMQSCGTS